MGQLRVQVEDEYGSGRILCCTSGRVEVGSIVRVLIEVEGEMPSRWKVKRFEYVVEASSSCVEARFRRVVEGGRITWKVAEIVKA